jgi:ferredoxin-NADP reductase
MLHSLAAGGSQRRIWWVHTTQDRESHAFATEVGTLIESLPHAVQHVFYTVGTATDGVISAGRPGRESIAALGLPTDATVYLCGPGPFMEAMRDALTAAGIDRARVHTELFGALPPINPGVVDVPAPVRPHPPSGTPGTGPLVTFARTGLRVNWSPDYHTLLELAEACDIPTRYSCRSGVCHTCVTGVVTGTPTYTTPPLEEPADGEVLICCAAPRNDLVLDL